MKFKNSLLFLLIILIAFSCKEEETITPPVTTNGSVGLVKHAHYYCRPDETPYDYVVNSDGEIRISVTGKTPTKFSQNFVLYPNDNFAPLSSVITQNGTISNDTQELTWNAIKLEYPSTDGFMLKGELFEYNYAYPSNATTGSTSTCEEIPDPAYFMISAPCYTWSSTLHFASGTFLNSTDYKLALNMLHAKDCDY